jgi:hypothetical protein
MRRVRHSLAVLIALCPAVSFAWPFPAAPTAQTPHPSVVRVIAAEQNGVSSLGSGVLVAVDAAHGLVVTNWHVVREATGPVTVVFPDGFRSGALVLQTDHDWDLAALAIQRPRAAPMRLAAAPPQPGEALGIAGYGPEGVYRAVGCRCERYVTPGGNLPQEILKVDVEARRGDSGGPIYNSRGEVAGILFGAGGNMLSGGYTMGSYCGRVRMFLAAAYVDFERLPGNAAMVAEAPAPQPPVNQLPKSSSLRRQSLPEPPRLSGEGVALNPPLRPVQVTGPVAAALPGGNRPNSPGFAGSPSTTPVAQVSPGTVASRSEPAGRIDQIKSILAVIGVIAILFHGLKLIGSSVG